MPPILQCRKLKAKGEGTSKGYRGHHHPLHRSIIAIVCVLLLATLNKLPSPVNATAPNVTVKAGHSSLPVPPPTSAALLYPSNISSSPEPAGTPTFEPVGPEWSEWAIASRRTGPWVGNGDSRAHSLTGHTTALPPSPYHSHRHRRCVPRPPPTRTTTHPRTMDRSTMPATVLLLASYPHPRPPPW